MADSTPGPWFVAHDGDTDEEHTWEWPWEIITEDGAVIVDFSGGCEVSEADAALIAAAPAMEIALALLAAGVARIETSGGLQEFYFGRLRYSLRGDWNALLETIGWQTARAALAKAEAGRSERG